MAHDPESSGASGLPSPERRSRRSRTKIREIRLGTKHRQWVLAMPRQLSPVRLIVLAVLVVVLALSIRSPLQSYFQQRSELQQLHIEIAHQEKEKAELQRELDLYNDDDFVREQARLRLGMVDQGDTAWRIIDPAIKGSVESPNTAPSEPDSPWYSELWKSVRETPEPEKPESSVLGVPTISDPDPNKTEEPAPANPGQ